MILHVRADARREAVRIHLRRIAERDVRRQSTRRVDASAVIGARIALPLLRAAVDIDFPKLAGADRAVHIQRAVLNGGVTDLAEGSARIFVAIRGAAAQVLRGEIHEPVRTDAEAIVGCQLGAAAVALGVFA